MKKPTICFECIHCDRSNLSAVCNAQPVPERLNLVTGQRMRPRPLCVDKNQGNCPDFTSHLAAVLADAVALVKEEQHA